MSLYNLSVLSLFSILCFILVIVVFFKSHYFYWLHINLYVVSSMLISFILLTFIFSEIFNIQYYYLMKFILFLNFNNLLSVFLLLAVVVANLILNLLYTKLNVQRFFIYINIFFLVFFFFFFYIEKNIFLIFLYYELLLLPSYFLIFFFSPNQRFLIVSIYFLIWTQIGSFLVFLVLVYLFYYYGVIFNTTQIIFSFTENNVLFCLIYIGFGIKIPIWPFFYWLTKTHVEAPSFFSIYLSGFLVKTALLGFYKFLKFFFITHIINYVFIFTVFSVIDSSLKLWIQVDLKKLVAFCTVQEMNLIFFLVFFNTTNIFIIIVLFSVTHAILSSIFFYLVDVVYRLYHSRSIFSITGLLLNSPVLAGYIYISIILYNGIPFTLKFLVELYTFQIMYDYNLFIYINLILMCNWLGAVGLAKNWLNLLFSAPSVRKSFGDLSKKEILFLNYCYFLLLSATQLTFIVF